MQWVLKPFSPSDRDQFLEWKRDPTKDEHGKTQHKSMDAAIMDIADDIAYGVHDLEDGIVLGLISQEDLESGFTQAHQDQDKDYTNGDEEALDYDKHDSFEELQEKLFSEDGNVRKEATGALVNALLTSVEMETLDKFDHPLLRDRPRLSDEAAAVLDVLGDVAQEQIIFTQQVQTLEHRGRLIIQKLFEAIASDPDSLLDEKRQEIYKELPDSEGRRVICDYIAGMTDEYATRVYERLFVPREGTVFDRL